MYDEDGSGIMIQGNFIGTDATGMIAVGNLSDGVKTDPGGDAIGGTDPGAGNLISGNGLAGIEMNSSLVLGNKIGTNISGDAALGNAGPGILAHNRRKHDPRRSRRGRQPHLGEQGRRHHA